MDGTNGSEVVSSSIIHCVPTVKICPRKGISPSVTPLFLKKLFMLIAEGKISQLKKIFPLNADLSSVETELLSQAAINLEEFVLNIGALALFQLQSLFTKIIETEELKLKLLDVSGSVLSEVSSDLLARAISRLEEVDLYPCLQDEQINAIFTMVAEGRTGKLRRINLGIVPLVDLPEIVRFLTQEEEEEEEEEVQVDINQEFVELEMKKEGDGNWCIKIKADEDTVIKQRRLLMEFMAVQDEFVKDTDFDSIPG